jgi:hypothetical protein
LKRSLLSILILAAGGATLSAHAAQPCGADEAVSAFQRSTNSALRELPTLDRQVDKCFNAVEHPEYLQQTHQTLQAVTSEYKAALKSLDSAYDALKRSKDEEFSRTVTQMVASLTRATTPLFDNAGNLKRYGFTVSDRKENGRFRYPDCNSAKNDQPERQWASFYQHALGVQQAGKMLQATVACLRRS